jgi:hypothetical protein
VARYLVGAGLLFLAISKDWVELGCALVAVLFLWIALFKPSRCNAETARGTCCRNPSRGMLRACSQPAHRQIKRRKLLSLTRLGGGLSGTQAIWQDGSPAYGKPRVGDVRRQPTVDGGSLFGRMSNDDVNTVCAVLGAVVGVVTLMFTFTSQVRDFDLRPSATASRRLDPHVLGNRRHPRADWAGDR